MKNRVIKNLVGVWVVLVVLSSCAPEINKTVSNFQIPSSYNGSASDSVNSAAQIWQDFYKDTILAGLIDTALLNNQELKVFMQEMEIVRNEVQIRKGEYLPFVSLGAAAEVDKVGKYTRSGVVESNHEIREGVEFPEPLTNLTFGAVAQWEVDIWKKLRNAKKSAMMRYLATVEGRHFLQTNLIAEIANSYFELLALDNQLTNIQQNIQIQSDVLEIIKLQKQSARVTELAVRRFEAQVLGTKSLQYEIQQKIVETENRLNFLIGRFPQPIDRDPGVFYDYNMSQMNTGMPSQLLANRADVRQAELELRAAELDILSARANFYPSLDLRAGLGFEAFKPKYLLNTPESMIYSIAGDLMAPLVNRNAIKAIYKNANAKQVQAMVNYEQTILNGYVEVVNELSKISNLSNSYGLKSQQVQALDESIEISNTLFRSARADYMEVLLTQREALESRFELIELRKEQLGASVNAYRALGGGWNE